MKQKPKTLLIAWEAAQAQEPGITLRAFALRNGFRDNGRATAEDVIAARLEVGRREKGLLPKPEILHVGAVTTLTYHVQVGWSQTFLFQSDGHYDSWFCNRALYKAHLDEALDIGALVFHFGDHFDAMQGRFDPRRSMDELRPEYRTDLYYDAIVNDAVKFHAPYASILALEAYGNHELSIIKNGGTDVLGRFAQGMNAAGANILLGGYAGWVRLVFVLVDDDGEIQGRIVEPIKYHHGFGGEAPVTKGAIQTNRQAVYLPDARFVVNGHSHNAYHIPIGRERLTDDGRVIFDLQHHLRIPGYKQDYRHGTGGWEVKRGGVSKPIGAFWITMRRNDDRIDFSVRMDVRGPDPVTMETPGLFTGKVYSQDTEYP